MIRASRARRTQGLVGFGLYGYLALTLLFPVVVIALWSLYDPAVGWFPPDILPSAFSLSAWRGMQANGLRDDGVVRVLARGGRPESPRA